MTTQRMARPKIRPLVWSGAPETRPPCAVRACPNRARYVIASRVVTGGRETERKELRCIAHGQTFADHKGLKLPPAI